MITDVPGVFLGQAGRVTVVLVPDGAVAGVDTRGAPRGTREIDLLAPPNLVRQVQAVCLAGGGSRGLAAVDGVLRWLEEHGHGFPVGPGQVVPIVPAAVVFDGGTPPSSADGYAACTASASAGVSTVVGEHTVGAIAFVAGVAAGVVVVDAVLDKAECTRLAMSAHDGPSRAGFQAPATVFALATGRVALPQPFALDALCTAATEVFARALRGTQAPCPD